MHYIVLCSACTKQGLPVKHHQCNRCIVVLYLQENINIQITIFITKYETATKPILTKCMIIGDFPQYGN